MEFSEYAGCTKDREDLDKITNQVMNEVIRLTNEKN